jgi:hypothetical protein
MCLCLSQAFYIVCAYAHTRTCMHAYTQHTIFAGNPGGKTPLGRPRHRWDDTINMDLKEIAWGGTDCTDLVQDRDQTSCEHSKEPSGSITF